MSVQWSVCLACGFSTHSSAHFLAHVQLHELRSQPRLLSQVAAGSGNRPPPPPPGDCAASSSLPVAIGYQTPPVVQTPASVESARRIVAKSDATADETKEEKENGAAAAAVATKDGVEEDKAAGKRGGARCHCCGEHLRPSLLKEPQLVLTHLAHHIDPMAGCPVRGCKARTGAQLLWQHHLEAHQATASSKKMLFECAHCPQKCATLLELLVHVTDPNATRKTAKGKSRKRAAAKVGQHPPPINTKRTRAAAAAAANATVAAAAVATTAEEDETETLNLLRGHIQRCLMRRVDVYACTDCSLAFSDALLFGLHAQMHGEGQQWKCAICKMSFQSRVDYSRHVVSAAHQGLVSQHQ